MKFFGIKYKLLAAFAVFLLFVTLLNAGLTSYLINRQGEAEAVTQLSRQLILFQNDLQGLRETLLAVAMEAASDEKNLSDMAILYNQALKLEKEPGATLDNTLRVNKITSLNRLQLILLSARLSSAAVYLQGNLSHYVTQNEAGMIMQHGEQSIVVGTRQKQGGKVQLSEWRNWTENPLPVSVSRHIPPVERLTVTFDFPAAQMMVLHVGVPIQGVTRESFNETIAENLTIAAPETLHQHEAANERPVVVGMFVFSKIFDTMFLQETAAKIGSLPAILSPDSQHRVQLLDLGAPTETPSSLTNDLPIRLQTVNVGLTSYYQGFMPWQIEEGSPALILSLALSRENTLTTIRQTVAGIIAVTTLILIVGGAIGYGLIARLVAPIKALTTVVSGMELKNTDVAERPSGEQTLHAALGRYLEHPIAPQSTDEIGELTQAFNSMAGHLRKLIGTLEQRLNELQRTSEALRQSEENYRSIFENSVEGIYRVSFAGQLLSANPAVARILAFDSPEEAVASLTDIRQQLYVHVEDRDNFLSTLLERGTMLGQEFQFYRKDRQMIWVSIHARLVRDKAGEPLFIEGSITDISDRKRAEEEIYRLNAKLEQRVFDRTAQLEAANKELEAFSYSVSHDLRAPLRAISGFSAILAHRHRASLNDEGQHYLDNIVQAGERMGHLIDDLLTYSRLGRSSVRRGPVALGDIFTPLAQELAGRVKDIGGTLDIADGLPTVLGDRTLLTQIFTNLLDNALTYRRADVPARVSVSHQTEANAVIICVCDNGIGIPAEHHQKIFNIFQRLHSDEEYPGTGIGLATVKKSVEMLGGRLWIESEVGKGSAFFIKLPKE